MPKLIEIKSSADPTKTYFALQYRDLKKDKNLTQNDDQRFTL